jgi:hypothetical protein
MDLVEMILAKCNDRIAKLYDEVLVTDADEKALGEELRGKLHVSGGREEEWFSSLCGGNGT